ncbi:hypothetical protein OPT61_g1836 [Boeremia exigua]|uniref:Uncharacterized protein n=1 Tax=Boeremia exigua TaxID=749465 RepID=A0ACC2INQ0_9PLEO|nr:hypothetical protein OPT61_g1836 [Boeremia exigua]
MTGSRGMQGRDLEINIAFSAEPRPIIATPRRQVLVGGVVPSGLAVAVQLASCHAVRLEASPSKVKSGTGNWYEGSNTGSAMEPLRRGRENLDRARPLHRIINDRFHKAILALIDVRLRSNWSSISTPRKVQWREDEVGIPGVDVQELDVGAGGGDGW